MRQQIAIAVISLGIGASLAGGIAVAATKSPPTLKACVAPHDVLRLARTSGKCPHGTSKASLNVSGPRGLPGAPGPSHLYANLAQIAVGTLSTDATSALPSVPAGDYLATINVRAGLGVVHPAADVECTAYYLPLHDVIYETGSTYSNGVSAFETGDMTLDFPYDTTKGTLGLACTASSAYVVDIYALLTKVGGIN